VRRIPTAVPSEGMGVVEAPRAPSSITTKPTPADDHDGQHDRGHRNNAARIAMSVEKAGKA